MKNKLFKIYILVLFLISNAQLFAQPGNNDNNNNLEGADPPTTPIDNYLWVLVLIAVLYVLFTKFKTIANKTTHPASQKQDKSFTQF